jgi:hypothetical protein
MIEKLSYQSRFQHEPGHICDIFDCENYHGLLKEKVIVNGISQTYRYFSGDNDIALSVSIDGYLIFKQKHGGPSATPILVQIYNLPPDICTHFGYLQCLGVVPGPRAPKDYRSFFASFDEELAQLVLGVPTFNAQDGMMFNLHAYVSMNTGDIIAIEKALGLKGHNSLVLCHCCRIKGVRKIQTGGTNYYIPLTTPYNQDRPLYDPHSLPLHTHNSFGDAIQQIQAAKKKRIRIELQRIMVYVNHPCYLKSNHWTTCSLIPMNGCICCSKTVSQIS